MITPGHIHIDLRAQHRAPLAQGVHRGIHGQLGRVIFAAQVSQDRALQTVITQPDQCLRAGFIAQMPFIAQDPALQRGGFRAHRRLRARPRLLGHRHGGIQVRSGDQHDRHGHPEQGVRQAD